MHVSLPRRSQCVGLSRRSLLWLCFGLFAITPWQFLRGEENSLTDMDEFQSVEIQEGDEDQKPKADNSSLQLQPDASRSHSRSSTKLDLLTPIFRSQTAPGPGPEFAPTGGVPQSTPYQLGSTPADGYAADPQQASRAGEAYGAQVRASVITGPAIGRQHLILPIELMPYAFLDNNLFFADVRGYTDTINGWGGNFGGGYRRYLPRFDRILGINGYYDYDNISQATFREIGFGIESLGARYDIRANAYFPTGTNRTLLTLANLDGSQTFQGHQLITNQLATFANALHGFDAEIGVPIPGSIPERHDFRVFGGGYWFEGQKVSSFGGWKVRAQANVIPSIALNLQVSHDEVFNTNVVFGATWSFGGYKQGEEERKTQFNRMTTPVVRQYNMVVAKTQETINGVTVINPLTNQPYFFEHVDSTATGAPVSGVVGDGTAENPFKVFQNAQAAISVAETTPNSNDIIFVHGNSVFGSSTSHGSTIDLQKNVTVLGEASGLDHFINTPIANTVSAFANSVRLPHPTAGSSVARPIFQFIDGNGVNLASNSEFNGFQIGNSALPGSGPTGIGIFGNGITNAVVRRTDVSFSGSNAVSLNNVSGTVNFLGDTINNPANSATTFLVTNTAKTGVINFSQDVQPLATGVTKATAGVINHTNGLGGQALEVGGSQSTGTLSGSVLNLTGSTINDTNDISGKAIDVSFNAGSVVLGDIKILNGSGIGLNIANDAGVVVENGLLTIGGTTATGTAITGTVGDAVNIANLTSTGSMIFSNPGSNIAGPANTQTSNFSGVVLFAYPERSNGTGTDAGVTIVNQLARGINLENNAGNVTFSTPVSIAAATQNNKQPASIEYHGSSGNVAFNSTLSITNGGNGILIDPSVVSGTSVPNTGRFSLNGTTTITNPGLNGITITGDSSTVTSLGAVTIARNQNSNIGIEILQNNGPVTFTGTTTVNNGTTNLNGATAPAVDIRGNFATTATVGFGTLNINNAFGIAAAPFGGIGLNIGSSANAADFNQSSVKITSLNIISSNLASVNSTDLFVSHEGSTSTATPTGLTIVGGTITNPFGQAVEINNSVINVALNQVNSTNSATFGIDLQDNQNLVPLASINAATALTNYQFQLLDTANVGLRTTGTIFGAGTAGINIVQDNNGQDAVRTNLALFQTGAFNIAQTTLNLNNQGITANGPLALNVLNSTIESSIHDGIQGINIPRVQVQQSLFQGNGTNSVDTLNTITKKTTLADNAIYLFANSPLLTLANQNLAIASLPTSGQYQWYIQNNVNGTSTNVVNGTLTTGGLFGGGGAGDVVRVDNQANSLSNPKALQIQVQSTTVNPGRVINTLVTGLDFRFTNNDMTVNSGNATSVGIGGTTTTNTTVNYVNGVNVNWTGTVASTSIIDSNTVQLNAFDQAFAITNRDLVFGTTMSITNNTVNQGALTGASGVTIPYEDAGIAVTNSGPTNLTISGNQFTFNRLGSAPDYGMLFSITNQTTTNSSLRIFNNTIVMSESNAAGAFTSPQGDVGILFSQIQSPASVFISNNSLTLANSTTGPNPTGIAFGTIFGSVALSGTADNTISINGSTNGGPLSPFVTGLTIQKSSGHFSVNGRPVP